MIIYNLLVRAYGFIIRLSSFRNKKARQWMDGRDDWRQRLSASLSSVSSGERIWVHCASYGEFEQGRTLMEAIRKNHPHYRIILSFFSPSGYEAFHQWPGADVVCYLPLDTKKNAADFIGIVRPGAVIFIKYEFWLNFLFELKRKTIPTYLVSAVFKDHHPFFKWYGKIFRRSLLTFKKLFIQDDNSGRLLQSIGIGNYQVCGDTRFDRVLEIRENFKPLPFFEEFCKGHTILVAGSTWPGDEELLIAAFLQLSDPNLKLILAPHHVDEKSIAGLVQLLEKNKLPYQLYSDQKQDLSKQILIVDTIGLLSKIYYYATVAYVGGGFDSGIHNCLEPAVYLKPVLFFGDDFEKYNEAVEL
ncbi:MAG TPA: glycosyltransferase N-terminal domain-containing protein, partial [Bacteroidia bacterium]|nr:glycosyltransferase N-terminal domain-containing protein [Bacteroidia bacterium]